MIDQISIKVIDARTQGDITHSTLLQIIIEQEENGPPLFSIDSLQSMIRSYGGGMQNILSKMFEQSMELFSNQQTLFKTGMAPDHEPQNKDPLRLMTDIAQKNMAHWQQLQHQWLNSFVPEHASPMGDASSVETSMHPTSSMKDTD